MGDKKDIVRQYNDYLDKHIGNVSRAYMWLMDNLAEELNADVLSDMGEQIAMHDMSKYSDDEYLPYAEYFYGDKTDEVKENFDYAWLHHIHSNKHHWQYWILQNDEDGTKVLDMPYQYIIEMVCDHWAFSWSKGDLEEIFNWYEKNKSKMMLSDLTRDTYEDILSKISKKLKENS